jgi:Temperature dependent protein affecting M2 dsRNA replication
MTALEEIYANTCWRTLQLRNYINDDHTLSAWGLGLADGLEKLSGYPDLYESLILGLELVRFKCLHHENFSVKFSGGPIHGSGTRYSFNAHIRCGQTTYTVYFASYVRGALVQTFRPLGRAGQSSSADV